MGGADQEESERGYLDRFRELAGLAEQTRTRPILDDQTGLAGLKARWTQTLEEVGGLSPTGPAWSYKKDADVMIAGLVILDTVLLQLGVDDFCASGRGVRHGVALELLAAPEPV